MSASTQNQYDVIYGSWPQNYNEVVLVVDKNNEISDLTLYALGLESMDDISNAMMQSMSKKQIDTTQKSWSYDLCGRENALSSRRRAMWPAARLDISQTSDGLRRLYNSDDVGVQLKIVGIVRPAKGSVTSSTYGSIGYTSARGLRHRPRRRHAGHPEAARDPDVDVFTGSRSRTPRPPRPSRGCRRTGSSQPAERVDDRATVYKCMTTPDDATLDAALTQAMATSPVTGQGDGRQRHFSKPTAKPRSR